MVIKNILTFSFSWIFLTFCYGQRIATLEMVLPNLSGASSTAAEVDLDAITFLPDSSISLVSVSAGFRKEIPLQISHGKRRTLHWIVGAEHKSAGRNVFVFELVKGIPSPSPKIEATRDDSELTIHYGNKKLLQYNFKTVYPPQGIDTVFKRSAFIHPLWTPHGQSLTRIQPPDHYHHYGIWNPWTHVLFEGDTIDFWNLGEKKGTVRFAQFVSVTSGPVFAEYQALHDHIVFKKDKSEKIALHELQTVRIYRPDAGADHYLMDITIEMNCATESPFDILAYRYAGLGWRATEKWNKDNSEVLTSEGKVRSGADGTTGRWFIVQGVLDRDYGGAAMMSYPSNYDHPEPMRIWPETANPTGEVFAMFAPTKTKSWHLQPGQTYVLKYRLLVFNGRLTGENAEAAWSYFAKPPVAIIRKN